MTSRVKGRLGNPCQKEERTTGGYWWRWKQPQRRDPEDTGSCHSRKLDRMLGPESQSRDVRKSKVLQNDNSRFVEGGRTKPERIAGHLNIDIALTTQKGNNVFLLCDGLSTVFNHAMWLQHRF